MTDKTYALVTGASSGIGYEYARQLAEKNYNLVIVSNEEAINDKAAIIRQDFPVDVIPVVLDLGQQSAAKEMYDFCSFYHKENYRTQNQKNNKYYKLNSCDFNPYKNKWL